MSMRTQTRVEYDLPTAVTFLLVGLAVGSMFAILFNPQNKLERPSIGINSASVGRGH
jgi:hypothetical protein